MPTAARGFRRHGGLRVPEVLEELVAPADKASQLDAEAP